MKGRGVPGQHEHRVQLDAEAARWIADLAERTGMTPDQIVAELATEQLTRAVEGLLVPQGREHD